MDALEADVTRAIVGAKWSDLAYSRWRPLSVIGKRHGTTMMVENAGEWHKGTSGVGLWHWSTFGPSKMGFPDRSGQAKTFRGAVSACERWADYWKTGRGNPPPTTLMLEGKRLGLWGKKKRGARK